MNRFRVARGREEGFLGAWRERADFVAWTESPAFSRAHGRARLPEGTLLGHPEFEGYEVAEERVG
jgi:heme-degrading monooxygenase HmoA